MFGEVHIPDIPKKAAFEWSARESGGRGEKERLSSSSSSSVTVSNGCREEEEEEEEKGQG